MGGYAVVVGDLRGSFVGVMEVPMTECAGPEHAKANALLLGAELMAHIGGVLFV